MKERPRQPKKQSGAAAAQRKKTAGRAGAEDEKARQRQAKIQKLLELRKRSR
jgi:hypothetical protein